MKCLPTAAVVAVCLLGLAASGCRTPDVEWATPRVVFVDDRGSPLPEPLQQALQDAAELAPLVAHASQDRPGVDAFPIRDGAVALPVGAYELRLRGSGGRVAGLQVRCTVGASELELRLPIATRDRVVRLDLRGVPGAGYVLRARHECGRSLHESGRPDGRHRLLLPPGPCTLEVLVGGGGPAHVHEHVFAVGEDVEQYVVWDVDGRR